MTGRERFLTAINKGRPDRLPCQVHSWMDHYLRTELGGCDQYAAYERFGMDPVIYVYPGFSYDPAALANWRCQRQPLESIEGRWRCREVYTTPAGTLTAIREGNQITEWTIEDLIKDERDFEIWNRYVPVPTAVDWTPVIEAKKRIGDRGIVRGGHFDFGQNSPWQSYCCLRGTEPAIMDAMDKPDWLLHVLDEMLQKKLRVLEIGGRIELDLVETGGGAGSNTVISPAMFEKFCLPYDIRQHALMHELGGKVVYHLCGGLMKQLDLVARNGADGLETMTPPAMGGDCDLAEAQRRVGDKLFFIGGLDQNAAFERGSPKVVARMVRELHACCPNGGYICSPSDHFFSGNPENIQAFVEAARECRY